MTETQQQVSRIHTSCLPLHGSTFCHLLFSHSEVLHVADQVLTEPGNSDESCYILFLENGRHFVWSWAKLKRFWALQMHIPFIKLMHVPKSKDDTLEWTVCVLGLSSSLEMSSAELWKHLTSVSWLNSLANFREQAYHFTQSIVDYGDLLLSPWHKKAILVCFLVFFKILYIDCIRHYGIHPIDFVPAPVTCSLMSDPLVRPSSHPQALT